MVNKSDEEFQSTLVQYIGTWMYLALTTAKQAFTQLQTDQNKSPAKLVLTWRGYIPLPLALFTKNQLNTLPLPSSAGLIIGDKPGYQLCHVWVFYFLVLLQEKKSMSK